MFQDRREAGQLLAGKLTRYTGRRDGIVFGLPRGGIPVAYEIAQALHLPLDALLVRKLGAPGQAELAMGAIAGNGVRIIDHALVTELGVTESQLAEAIEREETELRLRQCLYGSSQLAESLDHAHVIVVDDGIATGASMLAAIALLRLQHPAGIVVAVPVAPPGARRQMEASADEFVCLRVSEHFPAVGSFYRDFSQVEDHTVRDLLARSMHGYPRA